jgi:hypothetical protein
MLASVEAFVGGADGTEKVNAATSKLDESWRHQLTLLAESEITVSAMQYSITGDAIRQAMFRGRAKGALRVWRDLTCGRVTRDEVKRMEGLFDRLITCDEDWEAGG